MWRNSDISSISFQSQQQCYLIRLFTLFANSKTSRLSGEVQPTDRQTDTDTHTLRQIDFKFQNFAHRERLRDENLFRCA